MRSVAVTVGLLGAVLLLFGCATPDVLQGTVVRYDGEAHVLVVRDEVPPNPEVELDTGGAQLGGSPAVGDQVRVACREDGGRRVAERVMNLTRQDERRAGSGH